MKKIQNKTRKNKRGSYKNRIHKKTIRKGGMFKAMTEFFGRSPPTGNYPSGMVLPPPPPDSGDKRKREEEEEEECWICRATFSSDEINKLGQKINCINAEHPHYAHETCVSKWCDSQKKFNDGLCRCGMCQALIELPANIINAKFILPVPPYPVRVPGDENNGKRPPIVDDPNPEAKVPIIFQGLEDKLNAGDSNAIRYFRNAQNNMGEVITRSEYMPNGEPDVAMSNMRQYVIERATAGDVYALKVLELLAKYKGYNFAINFFIARATAGDADALKILELFAIDNGYDIVFDFFKNKATAGDAYALDIIVRCAIKFNLQTLKQFIYYGPRTLQSGEIKITKNIKEFIILAPPDDNPNSAMSKFSNKLRRWSEDCFLTETEIITLNIKMERRWWESNDGSNLPLGWYTKKIYNTAHHFFLRDTNSIKPVYVEDKLTKPGTILHDDDDYNNAGFRIPVWVLQYQRPPPPPPRGDYDSDSDSD